MTLSIPVTDREIVDAIYLRDFFNYVRKVFAILHPGNEGEFVPAWHVRAICHELDAIYTGENKRLVITVPPRHLKSITVAVAFATFLLGRDPSTKIIVASYGLDLARKHSADCRRVMETGWYRSLFPRTRLARRGNTVEDILTTLGGSRKAVSIGGAVTGHGADYIIIDDLLKAGDANSETELTRAEEFIQGTLLSRFNNPAEGRVILIGQRLHERDPAGYLLSMGTYRHLNLPAIAEADEEIAIGLGRLHRRKIGEALFPERMDVPTLEKMRRELGTATFNCQYQQNPIAQGGSPLRWEWFKSYDEALPRNSYQLLVQSWDTGMSADPRADYSVCTTWGFMDGIWHLLDLFRDRLDYPDLKRKLIHLSKDWRSDVVLIEDAATGMPLIQECSDQIAGRCHPIRPHREKEVRFNAGCARIEAGEIFLPREAPWLEAFRKELLGFPRAHYDDQVDSVSQFLNWSVSTSFVRCCWTSTSRGCTTPPSASGCRCRRTTGRRGRAITGSTCRAGSPNWCPGWRRQG